MKGLSIIAVILFTLTLLIIFSLAPVDPGAAAVMALVSMLFAIPYSIFVLVKANNLKKPVVNVHEQLLQLGELKDKNIISEYEFDQKKEKLLAKIR
ncbi:SHOCT domain-containing protein [Paenibacillus sp. RRE4]|uniref:SHOCT domain-containing protein n=1 Tax=Paenibacillus sp. RRE4 TaxID=2962587 RepID=UPI002880CFCD|nr:SHOCT domain-containing protein [Paenibacillus sp. RRE4]MDT0121671.1 SHOCT domain-containing protein [Paenibacillus sp. RRE4]